MSFIVAAAILASHSSGALPRIPVLMQGKTEVSGVKDAAGRYAQYREQNVLVTNSGRVVVVAQGRDPSRWSDRSGQDLVVCHSDDSGKTWSQGRLVVSHDDLSVCPNGAVYDSDTDTIHVLYNLFLWDFNLGRKGPESVGEGRQCRQYQVSSSDGGVTWSDPKEISEVFPGSERRAVVFGSGEGIQIKKGPHAGRLLMPGGIQSHWGNRVFYSDDHGKTWVIGARVPNHLVKGKNVRLECKVAELPDGRLIMNARCTPYRARSYSMDGGETWSPMEIDRGLEAVGCNGSILMSRTTGSKPILACSYPAGPGRTHGTVAISTDQGRTWPTKHMLIEEEFAYSSLINLPDGKIGLFYEARSHKDIMLVRLDPDDLITS